MLDFPQPQLLEDDGTVPVDQPSSNSRKRLRDDTVKAAGISNYMDRTLSQTQTETADLLFLRYI